MKRTLSIRKFRLGILVYLSKKFRFPKKISFRGDKLILPFTFHPKFLEFLGKWYTTGISRRTALLAASY